MDLGNHFRISTIEKENNVQQTWHKNIMSSIQQQQRNLKKEMPQIEEGDYQGSNI